MPREIVTMTVIPFFSPTTITISGPTGSGKSTFVFRLIENKAEMFRTEPEKIYYFYTVWQPLFEKNLDKNITFLHGLPDSKTIESISNDKHNLIILDDMQIKAMNDPYIANLFSRESHHRNLSVILLLQNLFHQGKYGRDVSLNSHYFILFKNIRDTNQIKVLGSQLGIKNKLENAYKDVIQDSYSYLVVDLCPSSDSNYMLRTHILPDEYTVVYK